MSGRFVLHIGAMKTGTSFLQGILAANAEALTEAGMLVAPNRSPAVHDVIGFKGAAQVTRTQARGAWAELVEAVRSFEGPAAVLSHEYLSLQGAPSVDRILATLEGLDVQMVLTVRDATAVLPAQWQTSARNNGRYTWPEYVDAARDETTKVPSHTFLRAQRIGKIVRLWKNRLGPDAVHVITVPRPDAPRTLLWERFAGVLGVDPALATDFDVRTNPSAGYATAHLLCGVHGEARRRELPSREVQRLAVFVADRAAARRREEGTAPLDRSTLRFAAARNRAVARVVRRSGVHVVGELEELPGSPDLSSARPLVAPDDRALVGAAEGAAATLAQLLPSGRAAADWRTGDEAVQGVVDLMASVIDCRGTRLLNKRGTALRDDQ